MSGPAWLAGPYCESGDILVEALPLPELAAGELLAVPVSGAYQLAMQSNYNGARKPAVVWLEQGQATVIQRRETLARSAQPAMRNVCRFLSARLADRVA